jgi:hypothetical protein
MRESKLPQPSPGVFSNGKPPAAKTFQRTDERSGEYTLAHCLLAPLQTGSVAGVRGLGKILLAESSAIG